MRLSFPIAAIICILVGSVPAFAEEGESKPAVVGPDYVHFDPLSFTVIGPDNRINEEISVMLVVQMTAGKSSDALLVYTPRLQDAYLTTLTELWDAHPLGTPAPSAKEIKAKLLDATNTVTGSKMVDAVLINSIDERVR